MMKKTEKKLLDLKSFGLAGGILWGASLCILTLVCLKTGYAREFLELIATLYPGYEVTAVGSLTGLAIGFVDGFLGCLFFAWLYNWLCKRK